MFKKLFNAIFVQRSISFILKSFYQIPLKCSKTYKGDCDNDDECYGDLKCGTDNCIGFNDSGADCCILVGIHQNALGIANNAVDIENIKVSVVFIWNL